MLSAEMNELLQGEIKSVKNNSKKIKFNSSVQILDSNNNQYKSFIKVWDGKKPIHEIFIQLVNMITPEIPPEYITGIYVYKLEISTIHKIINLLDDLADRMLIRSKKGFDYTHIIPTTQSDTIENYMRCKVKEVNNHIKKLYSEFLI